MSPDQPMRVEREDGGVELQYPNGARVILMPGFTWKLETESALEQILLQMMRERWQTPTEELTQRQTVFRETYEQAKALLMRPARPACDEKSEKENRHGVSHVERKRHGEA